MTREMSTAHGQRKLANNTHITTAEDAEVVEDNVIFADFGRSTEVPQLVALAA